MEIMMSFAEAILFIVVPQAEAWGFLGLTENSYGKFLRNCYLLLTKLRTFFLHYSFRMNSGNKGSGLKN